MPEVIISFTKPETLKALKALSKILDFKISKPRTSSAIEKEYPSIIPGDKSIDISDMSDVFSRSKMDAKKLRKEAWGRNKK